MNTSLTETNGNDFSEIGAELTAMKAVYEAIAPLGSQSRVRVFDWANKVLNSSKAELRGSDETPFIAQTSQSGVESLAREFTSVGDFFASVAPTTDAERALVVAYYLQTNDSRPGVTGFEINSVLKDLGHRAGNITMTMWSLINRRPHLVIQIAKEGTAKQARKTYKVTTEGMREVARLLEAAHGG